MCVSPQVESRDLPEEAGCRGQPLASGLHPETQSGEQQTVSSVGWGFFWLKLQMQGGKMLRVM